MIRRAVEKDIPKILDLLKQVNLVHYKGRTDIFKIGTKYSYSDVKELILDNDSPILVCVDGSDEVLGYCFCKFITVKDDSILKDIKTLYIDDLCVDEKCRGKGVGEKLYLAAERLAKEEDCYNLTLNVWSCNPSAIKFYQKLGLVPQKIYMEKVL